MRVMCLTNVTVRAQCQFIRQHPMCFKIPNMQPRFITKNLAVIFIRASQIQQLPCWNSVLPRLKAGLRQRQPHRAWRRFQPRFWCYVRKAIISFRHRACMVPISICWKTRLRVLASPQALLTRQILPASKKPSSPIPN